MTFPWAPAFPLLAWPRLETLAVTRPISDLPSTPHRPSARRRLWAAIASGMLLAGFGSSAALRPHRRADLEPEEFTVLVELGKAPSGRAFAALSRLQKDLEGLGVRVSGPRSYPVCVARPPAVEERPAGPVASEKGRSGSPSSTRNLFDRRKRRQEALRFDSGRKLPMLSRVAWSELEGELLRRTRKHFEEGSFLVPRAFTPDLRYALLRATPAPGERFQRDLAGRVRTLLEGFPFESHAYSQALGLGGDAERRAISSRFGLRVALLAVSSAKKGHFWKPEILAALEAKAKELARSEGVRLVVPPTCTLRYLRAVLRASDPGGAAATPTSAGEWEPGEVAALCLQAKLARIYQPIREDGTAAYFEVHLDAEGEAYLALVSSLARALAGIPGARPGLPPAR
ncbi:MAG: hypothetical protein D6731_12540 [Planctomycetota bacterium]|nr:MAG: hypothetical protein D6731_12540 [Planctomycetota bacterium]